MIKNTIMLIASLGFLLFLAVRPATIYEYGVVKSITKANEWSYKVKIQVDGEKLRLYTNEKFEVGDTINFTTIKVNN